MNTVSANWSRSSGNKGFAVKPLNIALNLRGNQKKKAASKSSLNEKDDLQRVKIENLKIKVISYCNRNECPHIKHFERALAELNREINKKQATQIQKAKKEKKPIWSSNLLWCGDHEITSSDIRTKSEQLKNTVGFTLFLLAAKKGHTKLIEFFIQHGIEKEIKICGVEIQLRAVNGIPMDRIVKANATIHTEKGYTALHFAADQGKLDILKLVVDEHCRQFQETLKPTSEMERGVTRLLGVLAPPGDAGKNYGKEGNALYRAIEGGHTDCARYLIHHGTDLKQQRVDPADDRKIPRTYFWYLLNIMPDVALDVLEIFTKPEARLTEGIVDLIGDKAPWDSVEDEKYWYERVKPKDYLGICEALTSSFYYTFVQSRTSATPIRCIITKYDYTLIEDSKFREPVSRNAKFENEGRYPQVSQILMLLKDKLDRNDANIDTYLDVVSHDYFVKYLKYYTYYTDTDPAIRRWRGEFLKGICYLLLLWLTAIYYRLILNNGGNPLRAWDNFFVAEHEGQGLFHAQSVAFMNSFPIAESEEFSARSVYDYFLQMGLTVQCANNATANVVSPSNTTTTASSFDYTDWSKHPQWFIALLSFASLLNLYDTYIEFLELRQTGPINYFAEYFNFFDVSRLSLFYWVVFLFLANQHEIAIQIMSVLCFVAGISFLRYFTMLENIGPFIDMFFKMIFNIMDFFKLYTLFLILFWIAFYVNNLAGYLTLNKSLFRLFDFTMGNYESSEYESSGPFMMILFISFNIFVPLILLNLLIAMMSDTYGAIKERSQKIYHKYLLKQIFEVRQAHATESKKHTKYPLALYVMQKDRACSGINNFNLQDDQSLQRRDELAAIKERIENPVVDDVISHVSAADDDGDRSVHEKTIKAFLSGLWTTLRTQDPSLSYEVFMQGSKDVLDQLSGEVAESTSEK